jgi:hypothetical protein
MYTGLHLDTTPAVPLGTDTHVPTTRKVSAAHYPTIFGGNSTVSDENKSQRDAVIKMLLVDINWDKLASLAHIERLVCGTMTIRLLAIAASKLSDSLQSRLISWCRRSVEDLTRVHR